MINRKHLGSDFDGFLKEEDILEEVTLAAIKKVISYQLQKVMEEQNLTKKKLAIMMNTSRAAVNRLLNPDNTSVTLKTIGKAARILGKSVVCELR
ncbi:MAG TPA: helix-turn-helix transcriptional regulator [Desulfomonilia bacterium]|jgi:antitoxin HicB|nr:helix-turn-helix transcriptional regulator [Desulfomonilia bacterium]